MKNTNQSKKYSSNRNLIISGLAILTLLVASMTIVKEFRGTIEKYKASTRSLNKLKDVPVITPSIYMYFSSNIGVLSKYLEDEPSHSLIGEKYFSAYL
jgi:hypothetical protein